MVVTLRANEEDMLSPEARCQLREKEVEEAGSADMVETAQGQIEAEHQRIARRRVSTILYSKDTKGNVTVDIRLSQCLVSKIEFDRKKDKSSSSKPSCRILSCLKYNRNNLTKGAGRNFSGKSSRMLQGRALQPFIQFPGGLNSDYWSLQWSKWKNFAARGAWPPAYAYELNTTCIYSILLFNVVTEKQHQCVHATLPDTPIGKAACVLQPLVKITSKLLLKIYVRVRRWYTQDLLRLLCVVADFKAGFWLKSSIIFCLIQCVDGQEVDMTSGDVTAELLEQLGSLIGGADVNFVSFCLYCGA